MRRLGGVAIVVCLMLLAACGGDTPSMSSDAATELQGRFVAVRSAVEARDVDGAARALDQLRLAVGRLRRSDGLSDARAADILGAAGAVQDQLVTITTTTTTTTTTTSPPAAVPAPDTKPGKGSPPEDDQGRSKPGKGPH